MTNTTNLHKAGLIETMCFLGVDEVSYWFIKGKHVYHCSRLSRTLHRKLLDEQITLLATWKHVTDE